MEDLYFENELRNRERKRIEEGIKEYRIYFNSGNKMSELTKHIYQEFDEILDVYYRRKFGDAKEYDEIYEMTEMFKQQLTDDRLFEMYNNHKFSEEEIEYIKLVEISSTWRGEKSFDIDAKYAITDILLRTKIIEQFGEDALEVFRDVIQRELPKTERYRKTENHYTQLLSDKPYGENVHDELEINIEEKVKAFLIKQLIVGGML